MVNTVLLLTADRSGTAGADGVCFVASSAHAHVDAIQYYCMV